ncbi:DUF262 domain-containing protein [Nocardia tengchongensis]|uniref:DUF262 domain-containing protein n=1 Tax=Nocardia tengchongensis TaxID=2055889 RepID=UPI003697BBFC
MTEPLDPDAAEAQISVQSKRIGYTIIEYTIEYLANKLREGEFYIPEYQRAYVWEPERKSRFIESVLLNLPIPLLFFWENESDGKLEIVDGSQRIRTIEEFLDNQLILGDLETLDKVSGFRFGDLKESRQRKLKNKAIRGVVLDEKADDQARADLFDRINTGSKGANPAEIRRGALPGPFTKLVSDLAKMKVFRDLTPMSEMQANSRIREELVTRFFALSGDLQGYHDRVADYLFDYSKDMTQKIKSDPDLATSMKEEFSATMEFIAENFPYGFKRNQRGKATPKTRYEAIAIGTKQALAEAPDLRIDKSAVEELITSSKFADITRADGGNAKLRVQGRAAYIKNGLLERRKS